MQKQGIDALKRMALAAKNRLRNKVKENDNKVFFKKNGFRVLFGESVEIKSKLITKEDDKFYKKVKEILNENIDVIDPISRLIDYKIYNKLDNRAKERYFFDLVDKYKKYRNKYQEEKYMEVI